MSVNQKVTVFVFVFVYLLLSSYDMNRVKFNNNKCKKINISQNICWCRGKSYWNCEIMVACNMDFCWQMTFNFCSLTVNNITIFFLNQTGSNQERKLRKLGHELRSSRYCWCDSLALAAQEMGLIHRFYIIEIKFKPWKHQQLQ